MRVARYVDIIAGAAGLLEPNATGPQAEGDAFVQAVPGVGRPDGVSSGLHVPAPVAPGRQIAVAPVASKDSSARIARRFAELAGGKNVAAIDAIQADMLAELWARPSAAAFTEAALNSLGSFGDASITDVGMAAAVQSPALRCLDLYFCSEVSGNFLAAVPRPENLQALRMEGWAVSTGQRNVLSAMRSARRRITCRMDASVRDG